MMTSVQVLKGRLLTHDANHGYKPTNENLAPEGERLKRGFRSSETTGNITE